ncbi:FHA domain-containing protein [Acetivibrio cellulolyticus]|uniref:FHA domain-containing protein n=1 Tax=Acetivibrio cellulolyticus TaxID=35830 RepID=UPI0001E2C715|nr:FHA domain-containing protein [Acetivibrio cellulolyticus]
MNIKIFGDTISDLQRILFVNKIECVNKLGISMDTFENWEKGRNLPNAGNSGAIKGVSIMTVMEVFEDQYQKRLNRGMLDRELLEEMMSCLELPDDTKSYLSEYMLKPEFVKRLIESAYEYHSLCKNRTDFLWKKLIEVYSNNCLEQNKKNIELQIGSKRIKVRSDLGVSLKRLAEGVVEELLRRDLIENVFEYMKQYSFQVLDKNKKIHTIRADENTYLRDIEEISYERLEIVERIGETTIIISPNEEIDEIIYPFMERILDTDSSQAETIAERFKIFKDNFIIGRISEYSDYVISSRVIGQRHALINLESGRYFITDLDSRNGTFVNGQRLQPREKREIYGDDIIGFVKFKYLFIVPEN